MKTDVATHGTNFNNTYTYSNNSPNSSNSSNTPVI